MTSVLGIKVSGEGMGPTDAGAREATKPLDTLSNIRRMMQAERDGLETVLLRLRNIADRIGCHPLALPEEAVKNGKPEPAELPLLQDMVREQQRISKLFAEIFPLIERLSEQLS